MKRSSFPQIRQPWEQTAHKGGKSSEGRQSSLPNFEKCLYERIHSGKVYLG